MTAVPAPLVRESAEPPAPTPAPVTCAGIAAHERGVRYIRLDPDTLRPYVGILGVLIGAILSFTGSRITTFGLADMRGGLHFGFDEGAWMTTSFGVGQMLVGVACPYLGAIFSVRRILLHGMALLFIAALLGPLSPNLTAFLTAQFLAGVGTGTFIPLTIGFIVRNLPQRLVAAFLQHRGGPRYHAQIGEGHKTKCSPMVGAEVERRERHLEFEVSGLSGV